MTTHTVGSGSEFCSTRWCSILAIWSHAAEWRRSWSKTTLKTTTKHSMWCRDYCKRMKRYTQHCWDIKIWKLHALDKIWLAEICAAVECTHKFEKYKIERRLPRNRSTYESVEHFPHHCPELPHQLHIMCPLSPCLASRQQWCNQMQMC